MKVSSFSSDLLPDEIKNRLNDFSFFTSIGFANLWNTKGGRGVSWIAEHENKIIAVLPGVEFGKKPMTRFMSMPNGCYGSMLYNDISEELKSETVKAVLNTIVKNRYIKTYLFDYYNILPPINKYRIEKCRTTLVDISDPVWEPPDKKLRQQIHKAEKEGINITDFKFEDHFDGLLVLIKKTEKRIKVNTKYSPEFFRALAELAEKDNRIWWYWCEHDGNPVSSNIFFLERDSILHWQSYIDEDYSFLQPNKYIPYQAAKKAAALGIKYLNLGASPDNAEGVDFYKGKWGGEAYNYNCLVLKTGVGKIL